MDSSQRICDYLNRSRPRTNRLERRGEDGCGQVRTGAMNCRTRLKVPRTRSEIAAVGSGGALSVPLNQVPALKELMRSIILYTAWHRRRYKQPRVRALITACELYMAHSLAAISLPFSYLLVWADDMRTGRF